jgi:PAS domain S-box-containing protein
LRKSELRYRSLIDQASDAIMITDNTGNFSDVNVTLCKMFGYTREELLHMNISSLIDPEQFRTDPIRFECL